MTKNIFLKTKKWKNRMYGYHKHIFSTFSEGFKSIQLTTIPENCAHFRQNMFWNLYLGGHDLRRQGGGQGGNTVITGTHLATFFSAKSTMATDPDAPAGTSGCPHHQRALSHAGFHGVTRQTGWLNPPDGLIISKSWHNVVRAPNRAVTMPKRTSACQRTGSNRMS